MSAERIPVAHLIHLLKLGLKTKTRKAELDALQKLAVTRDPDNRQAVLKAIRRLHGNDAVDYLLRSWEEFGGQAVFLWRLPFLADATASDLKKRVRKKLGVRLGVSIRPAGSVSPSRPERLSHFHLDSERLMASVTLLQRRRFSFEGNIKIEHATTSVPIRIELGPNGRRILQVHATALNARRAAKFFLSYVLEVKLPDRAPELAKFMMPVNCTETHAASLCKDLKMRKTALKGIDARGLQGDISISGRPNGSMAGPLDLQDALAAKQDGAKNRARTYSFDYTHADGYPEEVTASFFFHRLHSHVTFPGRTSRPAMQHLIENVCDQVLRP